MKATNAASLSLDASRIGTRTLSAYGTTLGVNVIHGGNGFNWIVGGGGSDYFAAGSGTDSISMGLGVDDASPTSP